jgi:ABC-2 type transport system ATP-binding protein
MIKAVNLKKYYGDVKAVDNIDFEISKGEITGFLGPNGAGKTTTMKLLTGYLPPDNGEIEIKGINVRENPKKIKEQIGYLPEIAPLCPDMLTFNYLSFIARMRGIKGKEIKKRIERVVGICNIEKVTGRPISELSKGYTRRIGLAQAMLHDPEVLILDEPTSGLDPIQIIEIRNLIKDLGKEKTVILSTHILPEVQATCNKVLIINNGKLVADGTLEELQKLKGEIIINIKIKAPDLKKEEIMNIFEKVENIIKIHSDNDESEEIMGFKLHTRTNIDLREEIFSFIKDKGWILLEMNREIYSLEEIFKNLTVN